MKPGSRTGSPSAEHTRPPSAGCSALSPPVPVEGPAVLAGRAAPGRLCGQHRPDPSGLGHQGCGPGGDQQARTTHPKAHHDVSLWPQRCGLTNVPLAPKDSAKLRRKEPGCCLAARGRGHGVQSELLQQPLRAVVPAVTCVSVWDGSPGRPGPPDLAK